MLFGRGKKKKDLNIENNSNVNIDSVPEPPMVSEIKKLNIPSKNIVNDKTEENEIMVSNIKSSINNSEKIITNKKEEKVIPKEEQKLHTPPLPQSPSPAVAPEPLQSVKQADYPESKIKKPHIKVDVGEMKLNIQVQKVTVERFFYDGYFIGEKQINKEDIVKEVHL